MSTKKWLILLCAAVVLCLAGAGVLAVCLGFGSSAGGLRVFQLGQTPSAHAGYLRTTMTAGKDVYVSDYEEAALRLANVEPPQVIGSLGWLGNTGVRAIPGQPVTAYLAGDEGSEMTAFAVFRHANHPAFNWRTTNFREMTLYAPGRAGTVPKTSDPALLSEVVRVLSTGAPVTLPSISMANAASMPTLILASDQLPGLLFCPPVSADANGTLYIAESLMLDTTVSPPQFHAQWIPASATLTRWLQSR